MPKRIMSSKLFIAVGLGGMLGAIGRYCVSIVVQSNSLFPIATLIVNLIGCFFLAYLLNSPAIKGFLSNEFFTGLTTGLLGAFTTFSTFASETVNLWNHSLALAVLYVMLSLIFGLLLAYFGYLMAKKGRKST